MTWVGRRGIGAWGLIAVATLMQGHGAAAAADAEAPSSIAVEGHAATNVVADRARLSLSVTLDRQTATLAVNDVAAATQAVVEKIRAEGIPEKDASTGAVSLSALEQRSGYQPSDPCCFRASTTLTVIVRPADRAGTVASHLVDAGANVIDGIEYLPTLQVGVDDDLRARAVQDARHKAETYVAALNLHLGRVLEIIPGTMGPQPWPQHSRDLSGFVEAGTHAPQPVLSTKPGGITATADVTVRWEIAQ